MDPPEAPSGAKRPLSPFLLSTTTTKRVKLMWPKDELTALNAHLIRKSRSELWPQRLEMAEASLLPTILNALLSSLAKTTAKGSFISPLLPDEAERFVEGFNMDERREWEDGIKMCIESGDWSDLITHRMYAVTARCIFLTTATARLQPVAITPNKARPSSETMCVSSRFCRW